MSESVCNGSFLEFYVIISESMFLLALLLENNIEFLRFIL